MNNPIGSRDGPEIMRRGMKMVRRPDPVYVLQLEEFTTIEAFKGAVSGHEGDYVAYDPMSREVWPIGAEYLEMHYELFTEESTEKG